MVGRMFLGRYEATRLLGEGGMGRVYLGRQIDLGRQVVIKIMHDHLALDPKFCERFSREIKVMVRFQHPYVVTLIDASLTDPQGPCIIMEYIRGVTLDTLLHRNGRLNPARVARLLGQLCEALQAAHAESIIHRDLKPANLMVVDPDTPYEKIKVMDFGLAKLIDAPARPVGHVNDTGADFAVGTPGYISPEQVRGDEMDHRSDLYSVGVILFELLTGRLPFTAGETMDVLLMHATANPPTFAEIGVAEIVSPAIEAVVQACLAKQPVQRPANARELAEMYEEALAIDENRTIMPSTMNVQRREDRRPEQVDTPPELTQTADPLPLPDYNDPNVVVHHLEAWMPETIATYKLRGFVGDVGGEVIESVPGLIRVRLGGHGSLYGGGMGPLSWLGLGRRSGTVDMELRLTRNNPSQQSLLNITVLMRSPVHGAPNAAWRNRCNQIFCDLRAYLMGQGIITDAV
jgi:serine/threonine-protein kinase